MTDYAIKLLIVDDDVDLLETLHKRLGKRNFQVTTKNNGKDALEAAQNLKFDLALLDLKMPEMNGKEVLEILKREHKFLEVIILTGYASMDSAVECTKLGAFSYLQKPFEIDGLLEKLRDAYEARLTKKFQHDDLKMKEIMKVATGESPLGILKKMSKLDDDEK